MNIVGSNNNGFYTYQRDNLSQRKTEVDADVYLKLLTVQLQQQDPTNPMADSDLQSQISQLADMNTQKDMRDQLTAMNNNMNTLNAATMIGKSVSATSTDGGTVQGTVLGVTKGTSGYSLSIKDEKSGTVQTADFSTVTSIS